MITSTGNRTSRVLHAAALALWLGAGPAIAAPHPKPPLDACSAAVSRIEAHRIIPAKLLQSIALVETGRSDPATHHTVPWPWSINVNGVGYAFATADEAITVVSSYLATGVQSIDVGCMQVNLAYHPDAFSSLEEAFDPQHNADYAAAFLTALHRQTGNWLEAAAAYHSQTPDRAADYRCRVAALWPGATSEGTQRLKASVATQPDAVPIDTLSALRAQAAADHARLLADHGITPSPVAERVPAADVAAQPSSCDQILARAKVPHASAEESELAAAPSVSHHPSVTRTASRDQSP